MLKVVVAAAAAVMSLCTVANAANGTWTYNVNQDAIVGATVPTNMTAGRFAQIGSNETNTRCWFGEWSPTQMQSMRDQIAAMVPGETYTLTFRIALDDVVGGGDSDNAADHGGLPFNPTVAVFKADRDWAEATATNTVTGTGFNWSWQGTDKNAYLLPYTANSTTLTKFSSGELTTYDNPVWATVTLDGTLANMFLNDSMVRGLRGVASGTYDNDGVYTKEKWGGYVTPNLVLTIVPEPATLGMLSLCSLALLRRKRS